MARASIPRSALAAAAPPVDPLVRIADLLEELLGFLKAKVSLPPLVLPQALMPRSLKRWKRPPGRITL